MSRQSGFSSTDMIVERKIFTEGCVIMIEAPIYSEIVYGSVDFDDAADDDNDNMMSVIEETGGYLTVLSSNVMPITGTILDIKDN